MAIHYKTAAGQPDFQTLAPQGPPVVTHPLMPGDRWHVQFDQVYMVRAAYYTTVADNFRCPPAIADIMAVAYGSVPPAYWIGDSPRQPTGLADLVTFTRSWVTKPNTIVEYAEVVVQMPGRAAVYRFDIGLAGSDFEWYPYLAAKSYGLPLRATIYRDFFLVGTDDIPNGIDCDYASPGAIPSNNESIYGGRDVTGRQGPLDNGAYFDIQAQNVGLFSGAVLEPPASTFGSGHATYTAAPLGGGGYWVGQSRLRRYLGNIWERASTHITL